MNAPLPQLPGLGDAHVLERARRLHLRARQAVAGVHHGGHVSMRTGHDVAFADYKPYQPGDALRDLDWRVLARTDRLVVKRRRAEHELATTVVLDASADLGSTPRKWDHAVGIAAALAWFLHEAGEPVGLVIGAGEGIEVRRLPPRRGSRHLALVFRTLAAVRPAGRAELQRLFREVGRHLAPRTLVAVVSDFMEPCADWSHDLAALVQNRVDLRAVHVTDPDELALAFPEPLRVRSPETGEERTLDPAAAREAFQVEVVRWRAEVADALRSRRGLCVDAPVGGSLVDVIARVASGRSVVSTVRS